MCHTLFGDSTKIKPITFLATLVTACYLSATTANATGYDLIDLGKNYFPYAVSTGVTLTDFRVAGTYIPGASVTAPPPEDINVGINYQAFYWSNLGGLKVAVPLPSGVQGMTARGINSSNRLVGSVREPLPDNFGALSNGPFAYTLDTNTGSYLNLQPQYNVGPSWAHGINDYGKIVCHTTAAISTPAPQGGYTTDITKSRVVRNTPYVATPQPRSAMAISNWDYVVGQVNPDPWPSGTPSQMWISRTPTTWNLLGTLPNPGGISTSFAYAVNSVVWPSTTVAGYNEKRNGSTILTQAAYYQGSLVAVPWSGVAPTWSVAYGVNKNLVDGSVKMVGSYKDSTGTFRAFRFQVGLSNPTDCNTYLTPAQQLKWRLIAAYAINDYDVIVGYGLYNDGINEPEYRGFILRPN